MDDPVRVEAAAMACLARRDHAAGELRQKLVRRGFDAVVVDHVVEDLRARGLQDDGRFIEAFVNARVGRGQGPVKIGHALRELGLSAALDGVTDWHALAESVRRRRFGDGPPAGRADWARQARFLQQRGFTAAQVRAVLDGGWDEEA